MASIILNKDRNLALWRGDRVAYGDGLENRCLLTGERGFESHPLRLSSKQGGNLKIHEYQAKAFLAQYGIPVPRGKVASTPADQRDS